MKLAVFRRSMTRALDKSLKRKPGRKSNFSPRKDEILRKFGDTYRAAHELSKPEVGRFLDKIANWAIDRWGYSTTLAVDADGEDDNPDEEFDLAGFSAVPDDDLSDEEAKDRTEYYDELRTVCLSAYYDSSLTYLLRRNWGHSIARRSSTERFLRLILSRRHAARSWVSLPRKCQKSPPRVIT